MLYREFKNFRDLNLKSFSLYNVPTSYKKTKERNLEEPLKAIFFINHNLGLNLLIFGDKYEDEIKEPLLINNDDNYEYIDFKPIKNPSLNILKKLEKSYYQDIDLIKTRSISKIDKFRHIDYPDDIEVLIPLEDKRVEQVWVRLIKNIDEDTCIGYLLHDSTEVLELKKNTKVKIYYHHEKKFDALILDSIAK